MTLPVGEWRTISPAQDCLFPCWHWREPLWDCVARQKIPSQQCPCGSSSGSVSPCLWCCHWYICKSINKNNQKFQRTFGRYHITKKNNTSSSLLLNCSLLDSNITAEIGYYHRPELVLWEIRLWLNTNNSRHILLSDYPQKGDISPKLLSSCHTHSIHTKFSFGKVWPCYPKVQFLTAGSASATQLTANYCIISFQNVPYPSYPFFSPAIVRSFIYLRA